MKILLVTNYLPPKIGGIERVSHELAASLNRMQGVEVIVASNTWPEKYVEKRDHILEFPYQIVYFPSYTLFKRLPIPKIFSIIFWRQLRGLDRNFDLVFLQSHLFILNWIIGFKCRKVDRRIWMNHGCNFVPINNHLVRSISLVYERIGMAISKGISNEFLGQSENAAKWITTKVGVKFAILSNAINLELFTEDKVTDNQKFKTKVLFVGRLVEGKGLLECISIVKKANLILTDLGDSDLFRLTIIGSGRLADKIPTSQESLEIVYMGELEQPAVIRAMYESDILIQAYSQPEGLTTVTLEGIATGMFVVTTFLSGDVGINECTNYFAGEVSELPHLLLKSRQRSESRTELIASGRRFIEAGLTWDVIAKKLITREYSNF